MRVLILNAYNRRNAGDAALLSALIRQVHTAFPTSMITFAGLEHPADWPEFEGARNVGSVRQWVGEESSTRFRLIARKACAVGITILPRRALLLIGEHLGRRVKSGPWAEIHAITEADLVIGLGGGYLNGEASLAGTLNVLFLLLPVRIATRTRRPIVLAPQSYGPFGSRVQQALVRHCLNAVDRIVVREDVSVRQLRAIGVRADLLERGVDSAFAVDFAPQEFAATRDRNRPRVGITARSWLAGPAQESYERSIAQFIDWLQTSRHASIVLIAQVTSDYRCDDDRIVARRVADFCESAPELIEEQLDHSALRSLYGGLDYLVGTRFHSVIFALTSGIPALAIEYEHKTSGIMNDLSLGDWIIPIREVTAERLQNRFLALEAAAAAYRTQLATLLPPYVDRADGFVDVIRRSVRT